MNDEPVIALDASDFSESGLRKLRSVLLRNMGLNPYDDHNEVQWPEPVMVFGAGDLKYPVAKEAIEDAVYPEQFEDTL